MSAEFDYSGFKAELEAYAEEDDQVYVMHKGSDILKKVVSVQVKRGTGEEPRLIIIHD